MGKIQKWAKVFIGIGVTLLAIWIISIIPFVLEVILGQSYYLDVGILFIFKLIVLITGIICFMIGYAIQSIYDEMIYQEKRVSTNYRNIRNIDKYIS